MFVRVITDIINQDLDWFFRKVLNDHYDQRRQSLLETNKDVQPIPAIDYVLQTCIGPDVKYPPSSSTEWHEYFAKLNAGLSTVFQKMLLIYLKLDISNYLALRERESTTGRQTRAKDKAELTKLETKLNNLMTIPLAFDFAHSNIQISTGLWALDNEQTSLMISCLSDPSINLANYFDSPKELIKLIVGSLYISNNPRMALFISKTHRYEGWDDDYDPMHAYLLISSGQLAESLKYERLFIEQDNYHDILHDFFELCSKCDVTRSLNRLNLSVEEEEALNQHLVYDNSRPITPSSTQQSHDFIIHNPHSPYPANQHSYHRQTMISNNTSIHNVSISSNKSHSSSGRKPRNRSMQVVQRVPSFNDSPARNTRSARKKKTSK